MRSAISPVLGAAAVAVPFLSPAAARADVITEPFQMNFGVTDATSFFNTASVPMFNPADGTLTSVTVSENGTADFTASGFPPGEPVLSIKWDASSANGDTGPFLSLFFFGPQPIFFMDSSTFTSSLAVFTGASAVDITISGNVTTSFIDSTPASGSFVTEGPLLTAGPLFTQGPLQGDVTYNYIPETAVPEPGSAALLATGLAALGLAGFGGFIRRA